MDWNPKQKINGISIQVCLNGYSFKVSDGLAARESGWLGADSVFTAPELQRRYPRVEVSLLTPKVALVPSSFFDESSMRQCLADTVILDEGDEVSFGTHTLRIINTPGHTPGGICFYEEADGVLLSGDSLFQGAIGRCDLPGGNMQTLVRALSEKVMTLPELVCVLPGHGPTTTIGQEKRMNPYL